MHLQGSSQSFVIMFRADGIHRLFSIPMDEMTDEDYNAHSVLGSFASRARQSIGECRSFGERVSLVEKLLLQMVHDFAEFTGGTPSETLALLEVVFAEQIRSIRAGRGATADQNDSRLIL